MTFRVDWTLFARVSTPQKCERVIHSAEEKLGFQFTDVSNERYWKDKTLFKVNAKSCVAAPDAKEAFYRIMLAANSLALRWVVNAPTEGENWEFAGSADRDSIRIQSVESIDFRSSASLESNEPDCSVRAAG